MDNFFIFLQIFFKQHAKIIFLIIFNVHIFAITIGLTQKKSTSIVAVVFKNEKIICVYYYI